MKKYIIGGLASVMLLGVSSCSLQYDPVDTYSDVTEGVTEEGNEATFRDQAAVESYLLGMYNKLKDRQEHWYLDKLLIAECHSDNAYAGTTGAEVVPYETNQIEGSNSVLKRDWDRFLEDVGYANLLINRIDEVSMDSSTKESIRAQAIIFRSLIFFDMVRMWGDIPCVTEIADDITAENIEEVYEAYFPDQLDEVSVYKKIEEDLLAAIKYAPDGSADKTRLSKDVAYALLAKVYAEKPIQDYTKVIQYVDLLAANGYTLNDNYGDIWDLKYEGEDHVASKTNVPLDLLQRNTKESILEAQYTAANGTCASWMFGRDEMDWDSNYSWAKWVTPSRDIVNAFLTAGDNVRYQQCVVWRSCAWSNYYPSDNYAFMYKCRAKVNSIIYLRYADLLLLKAEAKLMNGDLPGAADIIDQVRNRVGLGKLASNVRSNKDALLDAYLLERRLELAFEGQRWYDLVRLNKVEEVMNAVYAKDEGRKAQIYQFTQNSYRLPIPQGAIDSNDKLVQNPGY